MPTIVIIVDGEVALTTRQLAAQLGIGLTSTRSAINRLGLQPVAHLDQRTPLYAAAAARKALRERPGRGANLRGHT